MSQLTAPALIRREADIIERHGWLGEYGDDIFVPRRTLTSAAVEAIAGHCHLRQLTPTQVAHLAELLDHIEAELHMTVGAYESTHIDATGTEVAWELRIVAYRIEQAIHPRRLARRSL